MHVKIFVIIVIHIYCIKSGALEQFSNHYNNTIACTGQTLIHIADKEKGRLGYGSMKLISKALGHFKIN